MSTIIESLLPRILLVWYFFSFMLALGVAALLHKKRREHDLAKPIYHDVRFLAVFVILSATLSVFRVGIVAGVIYDWPPLERVGWGIIYYAPEVLIAVQELHSQAYDLLLIGLFIIVNNAVFSALIAAIVTALWRVHDTRQSH